MMDFPESCWIRAVPFIPAVIFFLMSHQIQTGSAEIAEEFNVISPDHPVIAILGDDAVLPCHLSPGLSAEHMQVRWFRTRFDSVVHLYENGMDQNRHQLPEYQGRTELIRDDISKGSVAVRIRAIRPYDEGYYTCFFQSDIYYDEATLELKVAGVGSALSISVNDHQDRGIRVVCESTGWYPEPDVTWRREDGQSLTSLFETETKQQNGLFSIRTSLLMRTNQYRKVSCHMRNTVLNQEQESTISVSDVFFHRVSRWGVLLSIFLLSVVTPCGLLVVLIVHKMRKHSKERAKLSAHLESLSAEFEWRRSRSYAVDVTLDPETAHPELVLSEDGKSVRHRDTRQNRPDSPQRFDSYRCVLGCEGFTSGRHYWEVDVRDKTEWALGVCKDSVKRKGVITPSPQNGYWLLWLLHEGQYWAFTSLETELLLSVRLQAVGILLDYEAGKVSFYDAKEKCHLFTFRDIFQGTLRPFLYPGLGDGEANAGALRIRVIPAWD
ncbi:butyrophilin subfamily 1 member A1-like [Rhinatrema bivittatum]|uniref:butyrophilin subfamily 1 member A1-like n=1 Tax=Rhinatrema bivittatum TaxID=194408 RepID=UPI00112E945C|nr:butyrophilin subfamily 1 member A1-like [Rhinatrema bivittatum]